MKNFGKAMTSIGSAGLKVTAGLAGLAAFPIKLAADLEKTRAEFTALIGDASKASKLLSDIEGLSLVTPLGSAELSAAARTLMGFGVSLEDIMPRLKQLGEVSGGDAERLERLALAFGQMSGKGRLMGQELNQMIEQGFNPLQEISRITGETMGELQDRMEAGGISAAEIGRAFESVTGSGGRFNGMMAAIAGTTIGKFNELKETIVVAIRPIGKELLPMLDDYMTKIKSMVPRVAEWISKNGSLIRSAGELTIKLGLASAAIVGIGTVVGNLASTVGATRIALMAMCGNPVLTGIAALTGAIVLLDQKLNKTYETAERLGKSMSGLPDRPLTDFEKDKASKGGYFTDRFGNPILDMPTGYENGGGNWGRSPAPTPDAYRNMGGRANAFASAPFANSPTYTPPAPPMSGNITVGLTSLINAAQSGMQTAVYEVTKGANAMRSALERQQDLAGEAESLDDEIARTRISAVEDQAARERQMIEFETKLRLRELQKQGFLSEAMREKVLQLQGLQLDGIKVDTPEQMLRDQQALFDTRFSRQVFGGDNSEEKRQTALLAKIERHVAQPGLAVV